MTSETYICAEPKKVSAYRDQNGCFHETRDQAIEANFQADLRAAMADVLEIYSNIPYSNFRRAVAKLIEDNPELVRVMLGDRDAT
ncbi:MAG: hypothetical protein KJN60_10110 [Boseongicola sp.]|nr:hypothetical protein [Boseongicola sp.]